MFRLLPIPFFLLCLQTVVGQCDLIDLQIAAAQDGFCQSGSTDLSSQLTSDANPTLLQTGQSAPDFQQNFTLNFPTASNGCVYVLRISGSYTVWDDIPDYLDACYRYDPVADTVIQQGNPNGLSIPPPDSIAPAAYNSQHEYLFYYTGDGTARTVEFSDSAPANNAGQMTFEWLVLPCLSYAWTFDGNPAGTSPDLAVNLPVPGSYVAELTVSDDFNNCQLTQNQTLTVHPNPELQTVTDNACAGQPDGSAFATASNGTSPYTYVWSDGATGAQRTTLPAGPGAVTVTDANGCVDSVLFVVNEFPPIAPNLVITDETCAGQRDGQVVVSNNPGDWTLRLDGQPLVTDTAAFLAPGPHTLDIEDANGCAFDSVLLIGPGTPLFTTGDSIISINAGETLTLQPPVIGAAVLAWTATDTLDLSDPGQAVLQPLRDGVVEVTATNADGCAETFTFQIEVVQQLGFFVPDAFSPNQDGQNDVLEVFAGASVRRVNSFQIFDRWGNQLQLLSDFDPRDQPVVWNGVFNGQELDTGPYVWISEVEFADGSKQWKSSTVVLLR